MDSLKGKVCLITGASSGIGEGTAVHLAGFGCRLALTGRSVDNIKRVSQLCLNEGLRANDVLTLFGDINSASFRNDLVMKTVQAFGQLNILVNNAGIVVMRSVTEISPSEFDDQFDINVKSNVFLTQLALPHIIKTKGCIINNSSLGSHEPVISAGVYSMTKACLDMFTKVLAIAVIVSNIWRRSAPQKDDSEYEKYLETQKAKHPLGRVGLPVDCAHAVAFLASDAASFITGQILFIDGGRHCSSSAPAKL